MARRPGQRRGGWLLLGAALALAAAPASAHLLTRGVPLSELAAASPLALIGTVRAASQHAGGVAVTLAVESAVLGEAPGESLQFANEGHHPPDYAVGARMLVFLKSANPPFVSRQTALDAVELPDAAAERDAVLAAVRAWAELREVPDRAQRIARLVALSLEYLESKSARVRREALLDLLALGGGRALGAADLAALTALARRPDVPATLGPGLVALLASAPGPGGAGALTALAQSAASTQVRALAAQALDRRGGLRPAADATAPNGRDS